MTDNEILMLATGIAFGAQLMNALHAFWGWRDTHRDAEAFRTAQAKLDAARERARA